MNDVESPDTSHVLAEADGGPALAAPPTWTGMFRGRSDSRAPAIVTAGGSLDHAGLLAAAAGTVAWLDGLGAPRGGVPVLALLDSGPAAYALLVGGACSGRPVAPLAPRGTLRELTACVAPTDGPVIVASPAHSGIAHELAAATGRRGLVLDTPPTGGALDPGAARPEDVVAVLHTSGTTGAPKRVRVANRALAARTVAFADLLDLDADGVYASAASFHHAAGISFVAVALGTGAAVTPMPTRFTVAAWEALHGLGVTHANVVPSMLQMLLDAGALEPGRLRTLLYGASRIEPELARRVLDTLPGVNLVQGFGQTEGGPHTALTLADHERAVADPASAGLLLSCGRPAPGVTVRIVGGSGPVGRVRVRSPHLFHCADDGWLDTGDVGRLDDDGYLYLVGRVGDGIVTGGENVFPVEVERVLESHRGVREAAVVGVPDRRLGQRLAALVVPTDPAAPPDPEDLRRHVRSALSGFKVPTTWLMVDALPRSPLGKLLRREIPADLLGDGDPVPSA